MATVLNLRKCLPAPPGVGELSGVQLRTFTSEADIDGWLELRHRAFARERVGVRQWTAADFRDEFLDKPWWEDQRMWLAVASPDSPEAGRIVGSVTLGERVAHDTSRAIIHWLMVWPTWRRRGVAKLLVSALEARVWELDRREIFLQTHAEWTSAVQFYEAMGYERV